jgi:hypothetical protein
MRIRPAVEADHARVMELQEKRGGFVLNPYEAVNRPVFVAEDGGEIVGVAIGRWTVEAFMALEPTLSPFKKAKAIKGLAETGFNALADLGLCEVHVLTDDPDFASLAVGLRGAHADKRHHVTVDLTGEAKWV